MSIKVTISLGSVKTEASLRDSSYSELLNFIIKHQDGAGVSGAAAKPANNAGGEAARDLPEDSIQRAKTWLSKHTASEVLNRISWGTNPDKILLLGAFHESKGGAEGWRSSDLEEVFVNAKESFPKNFPRDIRAALSEGSVGAITPRTYKIGRAGWNRISEAIQRIEDGS